MVFFRGVILVLLYQEVYAYACGAHTSTSFEEIICLTGRQVSRSEKHNNEDG
jgi:hypothetical protein